VEIRDRQGGRKMEMCLTNKNKFYMGKSYITKYHIAFFKLRIWW